METESINPNTEEEQASEKEILARNISFFRKKLGISQTELAKRLQYSNKNISKWELGETTPDIFTLKKLAEIFGVSVDTLLTPITPETKTAIKLQNSVPLRWKVYMLLLANAIFFLMVCTAFFVLKSSGVEAYFNISYIFVYMLPVMDLSVFIFLCCVNKKVDPITLSLFGWLLTVCFYISFINAKNIAYIFLITAAYQVLVPFFAGLINSGKIIKINKIILKVLKKGQNEKDTK